MSMHTCELFDRYRDGELQVSEQKEFQSHLSACEDCRARMSLLNNLVRILRQEEVRPVDLANQIARQAFMGRESWAALVVSWMRPGPAWAALSLIIVLFSFLFLMPGNQEIDIYSEYEKLMDEIESVGLDTNAAIFQSTGDMDPMLWTEQEGLSP